MKDTERFDIEKLKADLMADAQKADLPGVDFVRMRINIYDLTDFDSLTELEQFIQTGRKVHHIKVVDIPHIVIVSSPSKR
jgi:hypothetical protein